jgi:hypothetical protein
MTRAAWHLPIDISIVDDVQLIKNLTRGLYELVIRCSNNPMTQKELIHMRTLVGKL